MEIELANTLSHRHTSLMIVTNHQYLWRFKKPKESKIKGLK